MYHAPGRRGTVLILVLGLITLFMALLLSATVRVYNAGKTILTLQKNVQAHLMMQSAKMYIATGHALWLGQCFTSTSPLSKSFPGLPFADRLGWARVNAARTDIISAGGSTAGSGIIKMFINDVTGTPSAAERDMRNALELRYHYGIAGGLITLKPVGDNTLYPW